MTRLEAVRTACLAAVAMILVIAIFIVARIGHHPATRLTAHTLHHAVQLQGARRERPVAVETRISTQSVKGSHCSLTIPNGQLLQQNGGRLWTMHANTLRIENRSGYGVILKLRDMMLGRVRASIFVAKNSSAIYDRIPDGRYVVDYALGNGLDETCSAFSHFVYAGQLGLLRFAAQEGDRGSADDRQDVTIPPLDDRDADVNAIGKDAFDFD